MLPRLFESISTAELRPVPRRLGKRVVLMANDWPGVEVARYLIRNGDEVVRLYLHACKRRKRGEEIVAAANCDPDAVFEAMILKDPEHCNQLDKLAPDFIITVYWSHLLSERVLAAARQGTINFHPALLPINRGWYPHVHSILDGTPTGVTLHAMDETADTGPIWAQQEVPLTPYDTAYTIYSRQQRAIVKLFQETWPKIAAGQIAPIPQRRDAASFHSKKEVDALDKLDLDATMPLRQLIDRLRARSFGNRGFAYVEDNGRRVYLNLRLSPDSHFESS